MKTKPIFHLNVKREWFNMIKSGEKKEEYRCISPYWTSRLSSHIRIKGNQYHPSDVIICFSNGYHKNRDQIFVKCLYLRTGYGNEKWGAMKETHYFILGLGEIIKIKKRVVDTAKAYYYDNEGDEI